MKKATVENPAPPGLDLARFAQWYAAQRPGHLASAKVTGSLITAGKSNLTYLVGDGDTSFIVRRPPLGHVQETAHDMGREFQVISALAPTPVPVPDAFALCEDPAVIGAPFYVMERVDGVAYRHVDQLRPLGAAATERMVDSMIDVMAALHSVDPESVGLGSFGRPEGFVERQVRRWGRQLDGSRSRALPDADRLLRRLSDAAAARRPIPVQSGIVHGDYRLDNLLVADGEVRAVIDWEMATLGDPLTDLALLVVYTRMPEISNGVGVATASTAPGYPSVEHQLARYEHATGRPVGDLDLHLGLAHLKLAVILEGIHYRYLRGQTVGDGFAHVGYSVEPLLAAGLRATRSLKTGA